MDWQTVVVGVAILASAAHIAWSGWRQLVRPSESGCSTGCANCPQAREPVVSVITVEQLAPRKS